MTELCVGRPTPEQLQAIQTWVSGREVHDLGAGDMRLSRQLLILGATRVIAVDQHLRRPMDPHPRIQEVDASFADYHPKDSVTTAFLSWPANYTMKGLLRLVIPAERIIYLGKNTDLTACGWPALFVHFLCRSVLAYVENRTNTLIIYGPISDEQRKPLPEENAVLSGDDTWYGVPHDHARPDVATG